MMPILFSATETNFESGGIGILRDTIECTIEEERNGIFQLHMIYPVDGAFFKNIQVNSIIGCKTNQTDGSNALFDVIRISTPKYDRVEIDAKHISYRLNKMVIKPHLQTTAQSINTVVSQLQNKVINRDGFTFVPDGTFSTGIINYDMPRSVRSVLGDVVETFGGEIMWHDGTTSSDKRVLILKNRGSEKDITLSYGINITDIHQEKNIEETIIGIVPYWKGKSGIGIDTIVTLTEYVIYASNASSFPRDYVIPVDFSSEFKIPPTESDLRLVAQNYLQSEGIGVPKVSLDISFVHLSDTEEYKHLSRLEVLRLCDTIKIDYAKLNVTARAKVVRTVFDVIKERYTEISLGDTKIRGQSAKSMVAPINQELMQVNNTVDTIIETETALITLPSGFTNNSEQRNFYYRKGNICMIGFDCTPTSRVNAVTMVTLPTACRPVKALRLSALPSLSRSTDDGDTQYVAVNTDGKVNYTGSARLCQVYTFICEGG